MTRDLAYLWWRAWAVDRAVLMAELREARTRALRAEIDGRACEVLLDWYADRWLSVLPGVETCGEVEP